MKSNFTDQRKWNCLYASLLRDNQFATELNFCKSTKSQCIKIHYLQGQSLKFGSEQDGVISFIVTSYDVRDVLIDASLEFIKDRLNQMVRRNLITSFIQKPLDDGAVRVSLIFKVQDHHSFSIELVRVIVEVLIGLNFGQEMNARGLLDQIILTSENFVFLNGNWYTEQNFTYEKLGLLEAREKVDEEFKYKMNIQDLF